MKMTELEFGGVQPPIDGYAPDGFRIAGAFYEGALILRAAGIDGWSASDLDLSAAGPLLALKGEIDVLLVGTGADLFEVPPPFRGAFAKIESDPAGFGVDYMTTPSACRTYNVLLSEGRRVAAALLPTGVAGAAQA